MYRWSVSVPVEMSSISWCSSHSSIIVICSGVSVLKSRDATSALLCSSSHALKLACVAVAVRLVDSQLPRTASSLHRGEARLLLLSLKSSLVSRILLSVLASLIGWVFESFIMLVVDWYFGGSLGKCAYHS